MTDALSVSLAAVSELMEADPCEAVTSNALMTLLNSLTAKRDALREQIAFLQRQIDGVFEDMADQEYSLLAVGALTSWLSAVSTHALSPL